MMRKYWLVLALTAACGSGDDGGPGAGALRSDGAVMEGAAGDGTSDGDAATDREWFTDASQTSAAAGGGGHDAGPVASADGGSSQPDAGAPDAASGAGLDKFSFFLISLSAVRELSGNHEGFGGDLRFGEEGDGAGLRGADKICATVAEKSMPGSSVKQWRAFLSTKAGGANGGPVHAVDRIGSGPWYDRQGRLVAENIAGLLSERPSSDAVIVNDLPNETGTPNRAGSSENGHDDNHDAVTASNGQGQYDGGETCNDWTTTETSEASMGGGGGFLGGLIPALYGPGVGHAWPAVSGTHWIASHAAPGCGRSASVVQTGAGSGTGIGAAGGYGGFYCFALSP